MNKQHLRIQDIDKLNSVSLGMRSRLGLALSYLERLRRNGDINIDLEAVESLDYSIEAIKDTIETFNDIIDYTVYGG